MRMLVMTIKTNNYNDDDYDDDDDEGGWWQEDGLRAAGSNFANVT